MNLFIKKLIFYAFGIMTICIINLMLNCFFIETIRPNKLKKNCAILIDGDSHIVHAVNPQLFSDAQNVAQTGEPYFLTYWKLKKIFNFETPKIAIIGFAPHNLSSFDDLKLSTGRITSDIFFRSYPIEDYKSLKNIKIDYKKYYEAMWKKACLYPTIMHDGYIGDYMEFNAIGGGGNVKHVINRHYYNGSELHEISDIAISSLDSIIQLCEVEGVIPILLNTPVHDCYYEAIPNFFLERYVLEKERLIEKGVLVLDLSTRFYPDSLYLDSDHLNKNGGTIFTNDLIEELESRGFDNLKRE